MGDLATLRILDANLNRLKEGIRVVEDTMRYLYDSTFSLTLKSLRHDCILLDYPFILQSRDSIQDILKDSQKMIPTEDTRQDISSILIANFKRAQESARVLEEYLKQDDLKKYGSSETFKSIRYKLYDIEKEILLAHFNA